MVICMDWVGREGRGSGSGTIGKLVYIGGGGYEDR